MGFGWLFIGYFMTFLMSFSNYSHGIMLLGCVLMICGLARLRASNRFFLYPIFPPIEKPPQGSPCGGRSVFSVSLISISQVLTVILWTLL